MCDNLWLQRGEYIVTNGFVNNALKVLDKRRSEPNMKKILSMLLVFVLVLTAVSALAIEERAPEKNPYKYSIKIAWIPTAATEANCTAWGNVIKSDLGYWSNVEVNVFDGEKNADKQVSLIYDCIAQGYDGIILQSVNAATVATAVEDAELAGIPVVCINMGAKVPHAGLVSMTDIEAGYVIGEKIAEALGGKGNVVVIQATPGAARGELLEQGFQMSMANHPEITILAEQNADWNMEKANNLMQNFLTTYGDQIDAVFAHNDQMAEGAGAACEALGYKGKIIIWGANGESKALEYIEQGLITGTVYTNCKDQGATAARLLMMYLGSNIDTSTFSVTPVIKMPPITVTIDNLGTITPDMRW